MTNFFPVLDCKRAYRRFAEISAEHARDCEIHHIGATYMTNMVGNPMIDLLVLADDVDSLAIMGQPFRVGFDQKLRGLQCGDVLYYIGRKQDKAHLMRYKHLTEYINVRPDLKEQLVRVKKCCDEFAKAKFFKRNMDSAIAWRKQRDERPLSADEAYPLPVTGQETCFLRNVITRPNIKVGEYTYYNGENPNQFEYENVLYHYDPSNKLIIGKFCSLASNVTFMMSNCNHQMDGSTYPFAVFSERWANLARPNFPTANDTIVGNDVWIARGATIMPGVKIGDGAIIAANSVVTKDVPDYHMAGGVPAKVIKPRFKPEVIEFYQSLKWWDWPIEKIEENMGAIINGEVEALKGSLKSSVRSESSQMPDQI